MDKSLNQQTYDRFKKDIMTFAFKPGEPVSAAKIAERYEVSRTPAREALVKLETEGLVDIYPQSKSIISKINVSRAKQEWFVRRSLEVGMIDAFFDRVKPEDIEEMKIYAAGLIEIGNYPRTHETSYEYLRNDNNFHAVTYRVAGEKLAADIISNMMVHYNRVRLLMDLDNINKDRTVADHTQLIEYVEAKDREGYRATLIKHLGHIITDIETMCKLQPDLFDN